MTTRPALFAMLTLSACRFAPEIDVEDGGPISLIDCTTDVECPPDWTCVELAGTERGRCALTVDTQGPVRSGFTLSTTSVKLGDVALSADPVVTLGATCASRAQSPAFDLA